jgi:TRAP-type mannitol/chloroaromatic compound transport system substrate-binding protein
MGFRKTCLIFAAVTILLFVTLACHTTQAAGPVELKLAMAYPTKIPLLGSLATRFAKEIDQRSHGQIKVKLYEPNTIVFRSTILDAVGQGTVDAGWAIAGMWSEKNQAFHIFWGPPFSSSAGDHYDWIVKGSGGALYEELYGRYNVKPIPAGMLGPESGGWFRHPMNDPGDLQGLKIRFHGLGGKVMKKLGASVVKLPAKQILKAFQKNIIDATEFSTPYIDQSMNFDKAAKYYYYPGWHQPFTMIDLFINKDVWRKMAPAQQKLIKQVCHENVLFGMADDQRLTALALNGIRSRGVRVSELPSSILYAAKRAWQQVSTDISTNNKDFQRIYADHRAYRSSIASPGPTPSPIPAAGTRRDTTPPDIVITSHSLRGINVVDRKNKVTVKGTAIDDSGTAVVYVNDKEAFLDEEGNFAAEVYLKVGTNILTITAMDIHENKTAQTLTINRKTLSAAVSMPPAAQKDTVPLAGIYYALIIGNNNYKYLPKLKTAKKDAQEIASVLQRDYGFKTTLLLDGTRNQILRTVNKSRKNLKRDDHLLLYYAGHGEFDTVADKAYWLPVDAQSHDDTNWIIVDTITSNLKRIAARHILVVADSCYSGTLTRSAITQLDTGSERDQYLKKMLKRSSRTLLASGGNEPVSDTGGAGHSVFAAAFIQGLNDIHMKQFTAEELFFKYVKERVAGNAEQVPEYNTIRNSGHDGGDFVFTRIIK